METLVKLGVVIATLISAFIVLSGYLGLGSTLISNIFLIDYTAGQFAQFNIFVGIVVSIVKFFK